MDAEGLYAVPGLTDVHFHGCVGYDFCDGTHEAFRAIGEYQLKNGVTTMVPATMTLDEETLAGICRAAASYKKRDRGNFVRHQHGGTFYLPCQKGSPER